MSTNALVPTSALPNALVTFEGRDAETMPITPERIELVQAQSHIENGIAGKFYDQENGSHIDEFYAIPLSLFTNRVLFPPTPPGQPPQLGAQPLCRSNDGIKPSENVIDKKCASCANCSFARWGFKGGRRIKPACAMKLVLTFMDMYSFKVYRIQVGGTSVSPLNSAIKTIRNEVGSAAKKANFAKKIAEAEGREYKPETLTLGLDSFVIKIGSQKIISTKGTYYTTTFKAMLAGHKNPEIFREMYEDVKKGLEAAYAKAPEEGEEVPDQEYVEDGQYVGGDGQGTDGTEAGEPQIEA
jgi:hypothetical protein